MDRVITISTQDLEHALRLSHEDRLRQANAAFRLYHALHHPYDRPWARAGDSSSLPVTGNSEIYHDQQEPARRRLGAARLSL